MYDEFLDMLRPTRKEAYKAFNPRPYLFGAALVGLDDFLRFVRLAWPWGRGSGKTTTATFLHVYIATLIPRCVTIYFSDTINRAKKVAWPDFKAIGKIAGGKANESDLTITFPNGSICYITGMDHIAEVDRNRGIKRIAFVHGDECQDQESELLHYMVTKAFGPRMDDLVKEFGWEGRILLSGTGSRDDGYWFDKCQPENGWRVSRATAWDNPYNANPDHTLRKTCADSTPKIEIVDLTVPVQSRFKDGQARRVDVEDKETRREFFAEFNSGGRLQIFDWDPKISECSRAFVENLKKTHVCELLMVGTDFGTVDATATTGIVTFRHFKYPIIARSNDERGLGSARMVRFAYQKTEEYAKEFNPTRRPIITADGGSLGKGHVMDLQETESAWDIDSAEKQQKVSHMRVFSGDLKDGQVLICDDLRRFKKNLKRPEWHPDHIGDQIRGHVPDDVDSAYLGYRRIKIEHRYVPAPSELTELDREKMLEKTIREKMKRRDLYGS